LRQKYRPAAEPSHLENVYIKELTRFSSLYFQSNAQRLFQVALTIEEVYILAKDLAGEKRYRPPGRKIPWRM